MLYGRLDIAFCIASSAASFRNNTGMNREAGAGVGRRSNFTVFTVVEGSYIGDG